MRDILAFPVAPFHQLYRLLSLISKPPISEIFRQPGSPFSGVKLLTLYARITDRKVLLNFLTIGFHVF